ncbi:MAG: hypothetical protein FD175_1259 [Beijerinckiaceae bacterium]|nr:MAG: hypothetical protein FD175_1259 [Beijerinckiaceae bacterium]
MRRRVRFPAVILLALSAGLPFAAAQGTDGADWTTVKCTRYKTAYDRAIKRFGTEGIGAPFMAAHQRFIESNCTARADVCPVSPEEFKLANALVIAGMNAGMSGTFFPFSCRKQE